MKKANASGPSRFRPLVALIVLAALGMVLSVELLRIHLTVVTDPFHPFACHVSSAVDCNAVALSPQAVFLGVPVPIWGLLTYLLMAGLAVIGLRAKTDPWKNAADYVFILAAWSTLYSAYLAYVSAFVLKVFCLYCAGLYAVNVGLLLAGLFAVLPLSEFPARRLSDAKWLSGNTVASGAVGGIFLAVITVVSGLYVWSSQPEVINIGGVKIDISNDPVIGNPRAPITIIEFSDFECPACRNMHPVMDALLKKYPTSVRLILKSYPLDSSCNPDVKTRMHPNACAAAMAAECAFTMGKYEPVAKALWESEDLSSAQLMLIADQNGLDREKFIQCLQTPQTKLAIIADTDAARDVGVEATPTFVINGFRFTGVQDLDWCSRFVEKLLKGETPNTDPDNGPTSHP